MATGCMNYALYRRETGGCETCGLELKGHPGCEGCGILVGPGHIDLAALEFRGHRLCNSCRLAWIRLETLAGKTVKWDDRSEVGRRLRVSGMVRYAERGLESDVSDGREQTG
jgi:hypothetical protein